MTMILSTLLFAGATSAQLTTSFPFLKTFLGTDKIGFYGSVIGVSGDHTTLAVVYDNGTDVSALGLATQAQTFTIAPTMFQGGTTSRDGPARAGEYILRCEWSTAPDAVPMCTGIYGPDRARIIQCQTPNPRQTPSTGYRTETHTYSGRGTYSAGVETIVRTLAYGVQSSRSRPDWCNDASFVPSDGYSVTATIPRSDIGTFQLVVTAGQEKLNATQGAGVSLSSPTLTGSTSGFSTAAAMPMKTMAPLVAGLGAAIAVFVN
ncbi:hypothetical protein FB567DRAFT_454806 [Paraphoma chrysanthemicola]|uniref:Uncharacterized protein n=1 Tax=Paraphoma chrysanthemicola TaxID=798071 RepID=A0A8K0QWD9_9PLEO|nr:hypothetical protein FB567DRAFT_454806 [Paraphoma chrysanthemicola]